MANQSLNIVQKALVNETVRPALERMVKIRYYLDALVLELDNQQNPIAATADVLNDAQTGDAPRGDAPNLTGTNIAQLRAFADNMRTQIDATALNSIVALCVRDVDTIIRGN